MMAAAAVAIGALQASPAAAFDRGERDSHKNGVSALARPSPFPNAQNIDLADAAPTLAACRGSVEAGPMANGARQDALHRNKEGAARRLILPFLLAGARPAW
jgi:hypothetical protein